MLGLVFVVGVRLAAPVVVVLLIVELALGLIARVAPALEPSWSIGYADPPRSSACSLLGGDACRRCRPSIKRAVTHRRWMLGARRRAAAFR